MISLKRNVRKEHRSNAKIFGLLIIMISAGIISGSNRTDKIAMCFIFGLPILLSVIGIIRGMKKSPIGLESHGERLIISYYGNREEMIYMRDIESVFILIHSPKTAVIELKYTSLSGSEKKIKFWKKNHENFTDFILRFIEDIDDTKKVQVFNCNEVGRIESPYNSSEHWSVFLDKKRSMKSLLHELKQESLLKKIGVLIIFVFMIFTRSKPDGMELKVFFWMFGIGYLAYLIVGAVHRVMGYSRHESILLFFSGIFFGLFGIGSVIVIMIELINYVKL